MKAPEKIYANPEVFSISDEFNDLLRTKENGYIEYTQTEAFIEKACNWLIDNVHNYTDDGTGERAFVYSADLIKDFNNYMKGE